MWKIQIDMKTKFEKFIEESIPNQAHRESMRVWVKNALNGIKNEKSLMLYSDYPTGKTTLSKLICYLFPTDACWFCALEDLDNIYFRYQVKDSGLIIIDGFSESGSSGAMKCMIDNLAMTVKKRHSLIGMETHSEWPNILTISNQLDGGGAERRSIIIPMQRNGDNPLVKNLLSDLTHEREFITDWFLK